MKYKVTVTTEVESFAVKADSVGRRRRKPRGGPAQQLCFEDLVRENAAAQSAAWGWWSLSSRASQHGARAYHAHRPDSNRTQGTVWYSRDGRVTPVEKLARPHARNIIAHILREGREALETSETSPDVFTWARSIYPGFDAILMRAAG